MIWWFSFFDNTPGHEISDFLLDSPCNFSECYHRFFQVSSPQYLRMFFVRISIFYWAAFYYCWVCYHRTKITSPSELIKESTLPKLKTWWDPVKIYTSVLPKINTHQSLSVCPFRSTLLVKLGLLSTSRSWNGFSWLAWCSPWRQTQVSRWCLSYGGFFRGRRDLEIMRLVVFSLHVVSTV